MTLPLNSRLSALYDTNGTQKDFGFGFRVFFDPDNGGYGLEVRRQTADGYEVIPKSDYLVLPVEDNSAGVVRFSVAPSAGQQIYIAGKTPTIQQLVLTNFGRYSAESIETQFDFITAIIQEWLSALGEETRQRIAADEILTQYVVQRIDAFVQQVNQNFDDKSQEIEEYIATIMPSFTQTLREEIEAFAVAGMQDAIEQTLAESKAEIDDAVARANAAALAAAITGKVYDTPEAGVDPMTGVADGAYYNVRSSSDESYVDEYQNVGGVPTPTGKSYPSSSAINNIHHNNLKGRDAAGAHPASSILDASGLDQQQWNNGVATIADLITIPNPENGSRVFVKSYYVGLNTGGGEFVFKAGAAEAEVQGFVINVSGGVWKRVLQNVHSIDDAGAHPTKSSTVNANAINSILGFVKNVQVPNADYSVDPDIIKINNRNVLFGNGRLIGTAPDTLGVADGTGIYIHADDTDTAIVRGITLKNGYKSNGFFLRRSKNILIDDVTVDGMSYGITVAEKDFNVPNSGGSQNIIIQNPKILNTRYWGIYLRGANISTETLKSQNIKVINPYFYNCNMAGFVASEGNVKNFVLENPVFDRCNVCMHFEHASEFTVINARDFDTGKKPDHVQANTEYPFVNWSIYHAFSRKAKIVDCTLSATVSHLAGTAADVRVYDIEYTNTKAYTFVFEGVGALDSTNKHAFQNISWDRCTTEREFIYHQALDEARSWLRDFSITNSTCKLGINGNSGNGSYAAIASSRSKNMRIDNNTIHNATLRIACEDNLFVTKNTWIGGTDNTEVVIEGLRGGLFGDFCEFTGNMFERAGGTAQGDAAVRMSTFTRIRADNVLRGVGVGYAYRFANNYRIELGAGLIYDYPLGQFVETGTTNGIVYLSRA